jgi:hypothetical protein
MSFAHGLFAGLVLAAQAPVPDPPFSTTGWRTDFSKHSVPLHEIRSGGPPKDGIPAIDRPRFVGVRAADEWLDAREPVILFEHEGDARAYPLQILLWHEIVNDEVGGLPVAVTFCPLCNTAIAFDRRVGDRVLAFGTTGNLRHSDLVMYDRQTESWWQQATGEAIVGELTGLRLAFLSAPTITWAEFKRSFPNGRVLSRETGYPRPYGRNPYRGYDRSGPIFPVPRDDRLPLMERVVVVQVDSAAVAYPLPRLAEQRVLNHEVAGVPVVVFYEPGLRSALDAGELARSREVGSGVAFRRALDGRVLTFRAGAAPGLYVDRETGSTWTVLGRAVAGPLEGRALAPVVHFVPFWFAWAAFRPETPVYGVR